jgi:hypothetical protein
MAKPYQRQNSHLQPEKTGMPAGDLPNPPTADADKVVHGEHTRGGLWIALIIWAFVFGFLFIYLLIDLAISFFLR